MALPTLKLRAARGTLNGATIELDGQPVPGVRELTLRCGLGEVNEVTLTIAVGDVDVDADTIVALSAFVEDE